ncbi:MAG: FMN-binding negative transcriptional regulator [Planctomycetota bacterium]|nr:FMN-binding negative transcriptional regulator [Planctomycetota bacterium]
MYVPKHFAEEDPAVLHALMRENAFATLVTVENGMPFATHLPVLFDPHAGPRGTLRGHIAKANPQARHLARGEEALVLFQGPHAYVSPSWYRPGVSVPTWNYEAVHAYGRVTPVQDEAELLAMLRDLVAVYEAGFETPWVYPEDEPRHRALLAGIAGFRIECTRLEGKRKLNQNRPAEDRAGVVAALRALPDPLGQKIAESMAKLP